MTACLIDAGPLIAFLHRGDRRHDEAAACFDTIKGRALTVWPVLAEACHILGRVSVSAQAELLALFKDGSIELAPLEADDMGRIAELMRKYHDRPMDLADAALVRVAERDRISSIATFDRKDFRIYRAAGIGALKLLP